MADNLPEIKIDTKLLHSEYKPVEKEKRLEETKVVRMDNGFAKIYVGDSKNGWIQSLDEYIKLLTDPESDIHTIKISYNSVRPKGERLKTFGGTASGHEPLKEMFEGIDNVLKGKIDDSLEPILTDENGYGKVRPIHILDIGNLIGANVVVGGVRRTAEIFLFDADDYESMFAKYGINGIWGDEGFKQLENIRELMEGQGVPVPKFFDELSVKHYSVGEDEKKKVFTDKNEAIEYAKSLNIENYFPFPFNQSRKLNHRRMSNNSIAFVEKPKKDLMDLVFKMMRMEGEPGFVNLEEASRRVAKSLGIENPSDEYIKELAEELGLNPCVEVILFSKNVCNLTTVNVKAFVNKNKTLDLDGLLEAQRYSARIGMRMTLAELELKEWNEIQQRDRLLGVSLTGWKDAIALLGYSQKEEDDLKKTLSEVARKEADSYAKKLRVNPPMFVTAVKPEGTLSQVAGGVSSGLHWSHSPYYNRRVRINANDPLAMVAKELGWEIHAEIGTMGYISEEELSNQHVIEQARTLVITFPVKSGSNKTKDDVSVDEQFDNYYSFQELYTEMNTSNTISVKPHEWEQAQKRVWDGWENFVGVSFLSHDGGTYTLAPYEAISKEEYENKKFNMKDFVPQLLMKYEKSETEIDLDNIESCASGVCPIR